MTATPRPQIRPYAAADRAACLAIFRSNLPRYFDPTELPEFEDFLERPSGDYVVLEQDGLVVACGGCYLREGVGRLSWGMVSQQHHRASLGTALLVWRINHLFQHTETPEITIDTSQHTAGFFARHGFRTTLQVADGFGPGIDRVAMSLRREDWLARAQPSPRGATASPGA